MLIKVRDAIREKRRNEFSKKLVLFHQDNTLPHVSAMTDWTLYKLVCSDRLDLMYHPPYNPDMAPSYLYLFSHLLLHLDSGSFNSNEEVINVVHLFLNSRMPQFFAKGIEMLPKCWQTIVDLNGDYYLH
ncbi:hypothetical protein AVEN_194694-1 [Araneus ventricosus]|uniref:Histone-lysine N-methyltransferase SETMAR n=1 Tax=Araneus ventricosus TaxID=182803 RepID=A0A4Y2G0C7_ARAVE|nr:hypothetical protein AVEN_194694-1 [Araneus ventricosus]